MMRYRFLLTIMLTCACAVVLAGMGGMAGEDAPTRIPKPDVNYTVTVIDVADIHTLLTNFSIGGYTYIFGNLGKGKLAIPFSKIKRADIMQQQEGLKAVLTLKTGEKLTIAADKRQEIYGKTSYGNYKIKLGDVKAVIMEQTSGHVQ